MNELSKKPINYGALPSGVREHNERLLLTLIRQHGPLPGTDLANLTGLSAQTVSVILRKLDHGGFLLRGTPQRGRVGKPDKPHAMRPRA